jgi:hypothetical protein
MQLLLQSDEPARSQVDVLQQDPAAILGRGVDGLVGLSEALLGTDGDRGHSSAKFGGEIVYATGSVESRNRAHQDRRSAPQLVVDNVGLVKKKGCSSSLLVTNTSKLCPRLIDE